jgi:5-methylcytosine-specific restriction endonuclease McrA
MPNDLWEKAKGASKATGRVALGVLRVVAEASSQYMESPAPCAGCRQEFPRKAISSLTDILTYADRWYVRFCVDCRERLRAAYRYQGTLQAENRKVLVQLKRASDKRLPATLTLDQWVATLDYYGCKCAYCLVAPYEALEHVVPIERGGGTTADNCVPACKACNSAKGVRHPDDIRESSRSPVAMARVRDYLKTRQLSIPTTKAISEVDESPEQEASNDT